MATSRPNQATERIRAKVRISTASRLNFRLWIHLVGLVLALDVLLLAAAALGIAMHAEQTIASTVEGIGDAGSLGEDSARLLSISGISLIPLDRDPIGRRVPGLIRRAFPEQTAYGTRRLELPGDDDLSLFRRLDGLTYHVELALGDSGYAIVMELSRAVRIAKLILVLLLIAELVAVLRSFSASGRIIQRTMRPIVELAEKAQSLTTGKGPFSPEEIEALAGKLEGINAARLDTRIEVDEAQDELKSVATAINNMLDRINESYRAQARFVSDASHELRSPIAAIQGYVNLLDRWGKHDEQALQESIDAIKEEAANMKELIEQLLFLARGDSHAMPLQEELINLSDVAEVVVRETQMIDEGHVLESRLAPVHANADAALIKQALRILVDNAIKYTPAGGRIVVSVRRDGNRAKLIVQDDGIGIPPEAVPRVFDRFYRADDSRARATGGTGLGLPIAKWIAERHGGRIEVLSRPDIGTRISLVIRAVEEKSAAT